MLPRHSQSGQTLPLIVIFMLSLLGMSALAIDAGSWYQGKQAIQASADASSLAGAAFLGASWTTAQTHATSEFGNNKKSGDAASYSPTTTYVANDSIQVTVTRVAPTFFAKLFGKSSVTLTATSKATMLLSQGGAMPWAVMNKTYTPGTVYQIYTDNSGPNDGAVRLPAWDTGTSTCTTGNVNGLGGSALYRAQIQGGVVTTCPITINQVIKTDTGNNTGPTSQGIDGRCSTLQATTSIATFNPTNLLQPNSCQLVLLPVVINNQDGSNNWPTSGSGDVKVVGFSWWIIKDYASNGKIVDAVYVGPAPTDPTDTSLPPAYTPQLTG